DAPVAVDRTLTTDDDAAHTFTTRRSSDLGDTLTYSATNGAHGTVSVTGNVATYTPAANYNGPDSFTFTASDGTATSNTATITVTADAHTAALEAACNTLSRHQHTDRNVKL